MRFFKKAKKVHIPKKIIQKATAFSWQVIGTVNYSDSNQHNWKKIRQDHFISKLGEEAVCAVFEQYAEYVSQPDYHIYQRLKKSWEADLQVNGTNLAVKTQCRTQARKYGLSWTFQNAPARKDPILRQPNYWICFVECNDVGRSPSFDCIVFPPMQVRELWFRDPILPQLKGKKKVVYAKDFIL